MAAVRPHALADAFAMARVEPVRLSALVQDMLRELHRGGIVWMKRTRGAGYVMVSYDQGRWHERIVAARAGGDAPQQRMFTTQFAVVQRLLQLLRNDHVAEVFMYGRGLQGCAAPGVRVVAMAHVNVHE